MVKASRDVTIGNPQPSSCDGEGSETVRKGVKRAYARALLNIQSVPRETDAAREEHREEMPGGRAVLEHAI
jgi:hypothetical protein